jgi:prevent-host-death family protein
LWVWIGVDLAVIIRYFIRTYRGNGMRMKEDLRPVTYLKNNAADLLEQINVTRRAVVITQNGEARAVLQDPESYEQTRRAIGLLKLVAQGESDVKVGRVVPADNVFAGLRKTLAARQA